MSIKCRECNSVAPNQTAFLTYEICANKSMMIFLESAFLAEEYNDQRHECVNNHFGNWIANIQNIR